MSIDLLRISCPDNSLVPSMRELWQEAFGDSNEALDSFFETAYSPDRCRVVTCGKNLLSALYIFDCQCDGKKLAYIYAVATRKSARGQGIGGELVRDTHKYLVEKGYCGAILVPSEPSLFGFYEKLGYIRCTDICEFEAKAANEISDVRPVSKTEYAKLRKQFLPPHSVIQENENIDFLATYASFYKGEDFVLAAYKTQNFLRCVELLGHYNSASAVLRTLGCENGSFRIPTDKNLNSRPFSMICRFDEKLSLPQYFGLAFD